MSTTPPPPPPPGWPPPPAPGPVPSAPTPASGPRVGVIVAIVAAVVGGLFLLVVLGAAITAIVAQDDSDRDSTMDADAGPAATGSSDATTVTAGGFTFGTTECAPESPPAEPVLDYADAFQDCLDPTATYTAVFDTSEGEIRVDLDTATTPGTVNNFVNLARNGYYDGTTFFRTDTSIDIIQGGSPHTDDPADPGPGYTIPDERSGFTYEPSQLVMARTAAPDSAGAQFCFVGGPDASLLDSQGTYVVFGATDADGLDVLESILDLNVDDPASGLGGAPSRTVTVESVTIEQRD